MIDLKSHNPKEREYLKKPCICLMLHAEKECKIPIVAEYQDMNAGWTPSFEVMGSSEKKNVAVISQAHLFQDTKEDWKDVKVRLLSYKAERFGVFPDLDPFYLERKQGSVKSFPVNDRFKEDYEPTGLCSIEEGSIASSEVRLPFQASMREPEEHQNEDVEEKVQILPRVLSGAVNVASGINGQLFEVDRQVLSADFYYIIIPKRSCYGYLFAGLLEGTKANGSPATGKMYVDNLYRGKTLIDPQEIARKGEIMLGMDYSIQAERKILNEYREKNNWKGQEKTTTQIEINITNTGEKSAKVYVWDQVPVSKEDKISVKVNDLSDGKMDENDGKVEWEMFFEAGERKTVLLGYTVIQPIK